MQVSAVVVSHNGGERTLRTIEAVRAQTVSPGSIVVVDNGSEDGTPARIRERFPDVELVELGENRGLPAARNLGLSRTEAELVLLIDHDIYLAPDGLERMLRAQRATRATVVCPRIRLLPERDVVQADGAEPHFVGTLALRNGYRAAEAAPARAGEVRGAPGGCLLVSRERVVAAGAFDELFFFYFEDLEFSLRLRGLGHRFVVEPAALAFHDRGAGTPGLAFRGEAAYPAQRAYYTLRHRLLAILIHYRLRTLLVLAPALAAYEAATLGLALARGWGGQWLRAWGWQLRHWRTILERRQRVQAARRVGDRELLVGGPLPLAPGLVRSRPGAAAVAALSGALDAYWRLARSFID